MKFYQMSKPISMHLEHEPKELKCFQCERALIQYIHLPTNDKLELDIHCVCGANYPYHIDGSIRLISENAILEYERTNDIKETHKEGIMTITVTE